MGRLSSVMPTAFLEKSCDGIKVTLKPLPEGVSCPALRGREVYRAVFSFLGESPAGLLWWNTVLYQGTIIFRVSQMDMQDLLKEIGVWFAGLTQDPAL